MFGPKIVPSTMLCFQPKPLHAPISKLGGHLTPDLKKKAVFIHKCLLAFAGDSQSADALDPDAAAQSLLNTALESKPLRDEAYCQLIKQLNDNPDTPSVRRCEELLGFCLSTFPPSPDMEPWLVMFLRAQFGDDAKRLKKFTSALHTSKFSSPQRSARAIADLRKDFDARVNSRFSLQPGQSSGPSPADQMSLQ